MSKVFFREQLEAAATYWRILRRDGVALAFTSHDRDLWFDHLLHRAAPGMLPSSIRRTASFDLDSAEVRGTLSHGAISADDLSAGRYDGAIVEVGLVDWETLEQARLYRGEIGDITEEAQSFEAELRSAKAQLEQDRVPRSSPTCRAQFCGLGCALAVVEFTHEATATTIDFSANSVIFSGGPPASSMLEGSLRWVGGPQAGLTMLVVAEQSGALLFDKALDPALVPGTRALLREGCDHTYQTCQSRFANSVNFQGEPFLPGNDLIARYPTSST